MPFHVCIPDITQCMSTKKQSATIRLFVINHLYEIYRVVIEIQNQMHNLYSLCPLFLYVKCGSRHLVLMHSTVLGYHINWNKP